MFFVVWLSYRFRSENWIDFACTSDSPKYLKNTNQYGVLEKICTILSEALKDRILCVSPTYITTNFKVNF